MAADSLDLIAADIASETQMRGPHMMIRGHALVLLGRLVAVLQAQQAPAEPAPATVLERADRWLDQPHGLENKATWDLINDLANEVAELNAALENANAGYARNLEHLTRIVEGSSDE